LRLCFQKNGCRYHGYSFNGFSRTLIIVFGDTQYALSSTS